MPDKKRVFTVNLKHDGCFVCQPFGYVEGDEKQITDIDFEGMSFVEVREIVRRLVHAPLVRMYYCKVGIPLSVGIKELNKDEDVEAFLTAGYEGKWVVDLYT